MSGPFSWQDRRQRSRVSGRLQRARLALETLEDRSVPSWGAVPPATLPAGASGPAVALNGLGDAHGMAAITNNESDYYELTAPVAGAYTIRATASRAGATVLDPVLGVYEAGGFRSRLAYNDNISSTDKNSRAIVKLSAGQRIVFGITNRTGAPGGGYTWSVDGPIIDDAFENNDTQAQAYDLGLLTGTWWQQGFTLGDAADWFKFRQEGIPDWDDFVSLQFDHAQGDLNLQVYQENSQGTLALLAESAGTDNEERVHLRYSEPGRVIYVKVSGASGAFNPAYTLVIEPGTDDAFEDNDYRAQAANLGMLTARTEIQDLQLLDVDYYQFSFSGYSDARHSIYLRRRDYHFSESVSLVLFDSSGQSVRSRTEYDPEISLEGLHTGVYTLRVQAVNPTLLGRYELWIDPPADDRYEDNDSLAQAYDLGMLTSSMALQAPVLADGADWFRFRMAGFGFADNSGVRLSFDSAVGSELELHLYDGQGNELGPATRTVDRLEVRLSIPMEHLPGGEYFIRVRGVNGGYHPDYYLAIHPNHDDRYEDNDTMQQAYDLGSLEIDPTLRELSLSAELADDNDWYKLTLLDAPAPDGTIGFVYANWDGPLQIAIYDAHGKRVHLPPRLRSSANVYGMPGEFVSYSIAGLTEGTYFIRITGAEVVIDNGDGTSTGTGSYGSASPFYRFYLDLNDIVWNEFFP